MPNVRTLCAEQPTRGLLARLRQDRAGNVMAMMAAGVIPLIAMVGGAIDMSRLYMAKTRLQEACDAGALATRRSMASSTNVTATDSTIGYKFFDFNYPAGTYGSTTITRNYVKGPQDGTVDGTASAVVPTTVMKFFNYTTVQLDVTCSSTLNIPNTDVMFVLDNTGSMDQIPLGDTQTKMNGLKQAVKDFYAILGPGKTSGGGRIRYGFMPYSANVNVGKILMAANPNYVVGGSGSENWTYRSRVPVWHFRYDPTYGSWSTPANGSSTDSPSPLSYGSWTSTSANVGSFAYQVTGITLATCNARSAPATAESTNGSATNSTTSDTGAAYPAASQTQTYASAQPMKSRQYRYGQTSGTGSTFGWSKTSGSGASALGTCRLQYSDANFTRSTPSSSTRSITWTTTEVFDSWQYKAQPIDVSGLAQGNTVNNPGYWDASVTGFAWSGSNQNGNVSSTVTWQGCIEEASTVNTITASSAIDIPSGANDLNIDLIPSSTATKWKPYLPQLVFDPNNPYGGVWAAEPSWMASGFSPCPAEASRLATYTADVDPTTKVSTSFASYVDSLQAIGGTTHDIGMIWGARFLSPDGIFAADNADSAAPGGFPIGRHIVFMTDGTFDVREYNYDPWSINWLDGRVQPTSATTTNMNDAHNRRLEMVCNAMKGKGFTIWVVGFGISTLSTQLQNCATDSDHAAVASNSAALKAQFQKIAQSIGGLRLSN